MVVVVVVVVVVGFSYCCPTYHFRETLFVGFCALNLWV